MATEIPTVTVFYGISEPSTDSYGSSDSTTGFLDSDYNVTDYYDYTLYEGDFGRCVYEQHGAYLHIIPVLYSVFFLFGLLGNILVIWVITCGTRLRSMTDVCLLNLAFADLLLVCSLPFLAHQARDGWPFGDAMCKIVLGIYHIGFYCGIFFITLMSIDRYLAIVHAVYAMRTRTRTFGMIAAAVTWVAGFTASFPELAFLKLHQSPKSDDSTSLVCIPVYASNEDDLQAPDRHFWPVFGLLKMNILGLLLPVIIMAFCYSQIIWRLLSIRSSKKHAIRLVIVVVAVFFCCWVPYNITAFFKALELRGEYTGCNTSKAIRDALYATEAVAYSHSVLNPILYVFAGEKFKRHLLRLMNRAPCRLCRVIKSIIPQGTINGSVYSQTTSLDERSIAGRN
ncbi:C-C chemokine receptor type 5 [Genypterus blacodes]|uniref:C-C chemokine receptor type 5 n=1 Tax=Genypterus blacodes TaxID=154954 RepID=UPI003F75F702